MGYKLLVAIVALSCCLGVSRAFWFNRTLDCLVSEWSEWSEPFGFGQQSRERIVLRYPTNGGAPCPTELQQIRTTSTKPTISQTASAMTRTFMVQNTVSDRGESVGQLRDLLIIMDSSGSIGSTDYTNSKNELARLLGMLCPASDPFLTYQQAAAIRFSSSVVEEFDFNDKGNTYAVQQGIRNMAYMGSTTCTATAFNYAYSTMFTAAKGMRSDPTVKQEVLILTDGQSNCGGDAVAAAANLQTKADVYGLMIGTPTTSGQAELVQYVSEPLNEHLFAIESYQDLTLLVDAIEQMLLSVPCAPFDLYK